MISIRPVLDGGNYGKIELDLDVPVLAFDHLNGFNVEQENEVLDQLNDCTQTSRDVYCEYIVSDEIRDKYPKLKLHFSPLMWQQGNNIESIVVPTKPKHDFQNFLCSFNSTKHQSRELLVSHLFKRGWFNEEYSSKHFVLHQTQILAYLYDYIGIDTRWYCRFFNADPSESQNRFSNGLYQFDTISKDHSINFNLLQKSLSSSFVHLVSETRATSYYPFVTEKCLYSIANQGLFVAYAQPGWHTHLEEYFGFKKYNKIFDYSFDCIKNPVDRLLALTDMLSKFNTLNRFDWHDVWLAEQDTIMHNYMHFAGGQYLYHLKCKLDLNGPDPIKLAVNNY